MVMMPFPSVEPIRLLYMPGTVTSPGHYDVLVNHHIISSTHTIIDIATNSQNIFQTWKTLCKASSLEDTDPSFETIFNDKIELDVSPSVDQDKPLHINSTIGVSNLSRTLSEANIDFSLHEKSYLSLESTTTLYLNPFDKLSLEDFTLTTSE